MSLAALMGSFLLLVALRWSLTPEGAGPQFAMTAVALRAPALSATNPTTTDTDRDGLPDAVEASLSARYAPIVIVAPGERYRPASIDWLFARVPSLPGHGFTDSIRAGSGDPRDWATYVHVYPRADGQVSLQYWFFYPFNDGPLWFDHEGDWEHVTVNVDAAGRAVGVAFAQHTNNDPGVARPWADARKVGDHPIVLSARGSHASYPDQASVPWFEVVSRCTEATACLDPIWRTWEMGQGLINIGERGEGAGTTAAFAYFGRWGSAGRFPRLRAAPRGPMQQRGFLFRGTPALR